MSPWPSVTETLERLRRMDLVENEHASYTGFNSRGIERPKAEKREGDYKRVEQFLAAHPRSSVYQVAAAIGCSRKRATAVLQKLKQRGIVEKKGRIAAPGVKGLLLTWGKV